MSEWKEYKLGDLIITNAKSIGKGYQYKKIHYLDTGSITCNRIDSFQLFDIEKAPSRAKRLVSDEDIIYSSVRPNQLHYGYIKNPLDYLVVSTGFVVITCNKEKIIPKFLYYYLTQSHITEFLHSVAEASTSAYPSLKPSDIEALDIEIPPLDEQRRIAGVLSSLDDKIDLLHRENTTLEALAEILFRHYFIENPNPDWKEGKLGDVCSYITDKLETYGLTTMSYISTENMLNDKKGVAKSTSIPDNVRVTRYEVGDVLLSNIRPYFKKIWLADRLGGCSNDVLCIRSNGKELEYFVYYTLRQDDFFDYVMLGSKGCKMPRGDKQHIMNWPICMPDVESLSDFNKHVFPMIQKVKSNQKQILSLSSQRDTLLPRLMSGEVRVDGQ